MKVLFAVNDEKISESIIKRYQKDYKEIISAKNVYYYNAIIKELQKDKSYDRIVIGEDLEPFSSDDYSTIDKFLFDKLDKISDEAYNTIGNDIPIILICTDRRTRPEPLLTKLFGISVYNALIGQDRSIDEVCELIKKPRSKKEAKKYYQIDSEKVEYKPENESDVSEAEIQNILAHYKRLGKDENKYVTSFDSIVSQYNDEQLKLIINFLPQNVQKVLEEKSSNYRQLIGLDPKIVKKNNKNDKVIEKQRIEILDKELNKSKLSTPVIIPNAVNTQKVKKVIKKETENIKNSDIETIKQKKIQTPVKKESYSEVDSILEELDSPVKTEKRGRGRPPKENKEKLQTVEKTEKRGRGRPRKIKKDEEIEDLITGFEELDKEQSSSKMKKNKNSSKEDELDNILQGYDDIDELEDYDDNVLPGYDEEDEMQESDDDILPGYDEKDEMQESDDILPGYDEEDEMQESDDDILPGYDEKDEMQESDDNILPGYDEEDEEEDDEQYAENSKFQGPIQNINFNNNGKDNINNSIQNRNYSNSQINVNIDSLLTSDKKIVSFVGTSKNGTSFLVNNLAQLLSERGIKTAILDLTQNRNAYYIYTDNRDDLRNIAYKSIQNLNNGIPEGININKNLTVFTSLPGEIEDLKHTQEIIETLLNNYSLILLDCDYMTEYSYFNISQEIYLVQSLDVLTIQPLTAFLRELKARNILDINKLRVVINKYIKNQINNKMIIGGISSYNDPSMSYMTELFNKEKMKYITVPFELQNYSAYLESLVNCKITLKGYSKNLLKSLEELGNMVFPLLGSGRNQTNYNNYNGSFSKNTNNTLNKMKTKF